MKTFQANDELIEILKNQGFFEVTSTGSKRKEERNFKTALSSRKEIQFSKIDIIIRNRHHDCDKRREITEAELKLMLFYFKLSSEDSKEFNPSGMFNFRVMEQQIGVLRKELELSKLFETRIFRQNKISRLLSIYDEITF